MTIKLMNTADISLKNGIKSDITTEMINEILEYSLITGKFYWKKRISIRIKHIGAEAGTIWWNVNNPEYKYTVIGFYGKRILAHKLAWFMITGSLPEGELDHKDGNGLNNAWLNLRPAERFENSSNTRKHKDGVCKYKGVSYDKNRGLFVAQLMHKGVKSNLGRFKTQEEARDAYVAESLRLHKEFATMRGSEGYDSQTS